MAALSFAGTARATQAGSTVPWPGERGRDRRGRRHAGLQRRLGACRRPECDRVPATAGQRYGGRGQRHADVPGRAGPCHPRRRHPPGRRTGAGRRQYRRRQQRDSPSAGAGRRSTRPPPAWATPPATVPRCWRCPTAGWTFSVRRAPAPSPSAPGRSCTRRARWRSPPTAGSIWTRAPASVRAISRWR